MSGYGVNVPEMLKTAGLTSAEDKSGSPKERTSTGTVSGLILIG
jgi:hypothetical protein